jgi:hypothetical protein
MNVDLVLVQRLLTKRRVVERREDPKKAFRHE